jgi:hypothetical protein
MKAKLGLVLSSGAAPGWAHIGAIRALEEAGVVDYHRAGEAIAEGRAAVKRMLPSIEHALESP